MMTPREIERLFRKYKAGDRVVAVMDIIYGTGGETPEGTEGTVQDAVMVVDAEGAGPSTPSTRHEVPSGLAVVRWDTGLLKATSTVAIDPVVPLVEVELHSTAPAAVEATRATIEALPGGCLIERRGRFYVPGGAVAWMAERQGYVHRVLPFPRESRSGVAGACGVCGKERHEDGSPVTWRCRVCARHVCRDCTRVIPGSSPREYHEVTLCSNACWEAAGRPAD